MYAVKAIYDGINFKPSQPIPVRGQYEVVITFVEQIALDTPDDTSEDMTKKTNIEYWQEFKKLAADSHDEILSIHDFPRTKFGRELVLFDDEEQTT